MSGREADQLLKLHFRSRISRAGSRLCDGSGRHFAGTLNTAQLRKGNHKIRQAPTWHFSSFMAVRISFRSESLCNFTMARNCDATMIHASGGKVLGLPDNHHATDLLAFRCYQSSSDDEPALKTLQHYISNAVLDKNYRFHATFNRRTFETRRVDRSMHAVTNLQIILIKCSSKTETASKRTSLYDLARSSRIYNARVMCARKGFQTYLRFAYSNSSFCSKAHIGIRRNSISVLHHNSLISLTVAALSRRFDSLNDLVMIQHHMFQIDFRSFEPAVSTHEPPESDQSLFVLPLVCGTFCFFKERQQKERQQGGDLPSDRRTQLQSNSWLPR